jgi:5'-3' exonuclease
MASRLMLLDSASLYYRAFYGVPDRFTAVDGSPTNAIRGFIDMVAQLIERFSPDELVACWDDDWRPQFRVELVPSYKAHRVAQEVDPDTAQGSDSSGDDDIEEMPDALSVQEPVIADVLTAVGIPVVGAAGFEADDVIAQLARDHAGGVDVVTGDRDLFQLVDDSRGVRVLYTARGLAKLGLVDATWVEDKYGVTPQRYADFALLRGDASDGLPGVAGVGDKTAAKLVNEFGGIANIIEAAQREDTTLAPRVRTNVAASRDYLTRADPVVRLDHSVPVPSGPFPLVQKPADAKTLETLVSEQRISRQVDRLLNALSS